MAPEPGAAIRKDALRAPAVVAPMFLVSGPDLVIASCRSGLVGSFPMQNARTHDDLIAWLDKISTGIADLDDPQWAVNLIVHGTYDRFGAELELVVENRPNVVIRALGSLIVGGAISTGRGARAVEVLGADFAYMGTRFI